MANYAISSLKLSDTYVNTLPYGSCSEAGEKSAKTVNVGTFALDKGAMVVVKFTNANSASNPTLNVSSTGAKAIYYKSAAISASYIKANHVYLFVYNGTQWDMAGDIEFPYVSQQFDTESSDLRVILSKTASDTTETGAVKKSSGFTFSPSTGTVNIGTISDNEDDMEYVAGTGTLKVAGSIIAGSGSDAHGIYPAKDNYSTLGSEEYRWYQIYGYNLYGDNISGDTIYEGNVTLSEKYSPKSHASSATTYGSASASVYGHAMASSTSPKMDGTAAVGSETAKFARGDHVHPTDTSRAPKSHTSSTASTYGSASASVYGHAMASSTTPKAPGTAAVGSETAKFARGDHVHPAQTVLTIKTWEAAD